MTIDLVALDGSYRVLRSRTGRPLIGALLQAWGLLQASFPARMRAISTAFRARSAAAIGLPRDVRLRASPSSRPACPRVLRPGSYTGDALARYPPATARPDRQVDFTITSEQGTVGDLFGSSQHAPLLPCADHEHSSPCSSAIAQGAAGRPPRLEVSGAPCFAFIYGVTPRPTSHRVDRPWMSSGRRLLLCSGPRERACRSSHHSLEPTSRQSLRFDALEACLPFCDDGDRRDHALSLRSPT